MGDWFDIGSRALTASINPFGAELSSLRDRRGRQLMTNADPHFWSGRAPILFPIVGRLNDDVLWLDETSYRMEKHGFARRSMFDVAESSASHAVLRLINSARTMESYPFPFLLEIGFVVDDTTLTMTAIIGNTGDAPMPVSFGWHPAFAWPLPGGAAREDHYIDFEVDEPAPLKGLNEAGLIAEDRATPVIGNRLALADPLFERDALIWNPVTSQRLRYGSDTGPQLDIAFPDTPSLGIWTKPGARFVCIEPWHGTADSTGFGGDFREKPGVMMLEPGARHRIEMRVTVTG